MSGEEIRFIRNGKEVSFKVGEEVSNEIKMKDGKKIFQNLFDAIANSDGNKDLSADEMKMVKDLQTIFAKTGNDKKNGDAQVLDNDDMKLAEEFLNSKMTIKEFIASKLKALTPVEPTADASSKDNLVVSTEDPEITSSKEEETNLEQPVNKQPVVNTEPTQADKNKQFNNAMQNLAKRKFGAQKDQLSSDFTKEVGYEKGKYLYNIAKEALQAEGAQNPSAKEINERIAQIALVNDIEDVNNVPENKFPLKVGKGVPASVEQELEQGQDAPGSGRGTDTVPVELQESSIKVGRVQNYEEEGWSAPELLSEDELKDFEGLEFNSLYKTSKKVNEELKTAYVLSIEGTNSFMSFDEKDHLKTFLGAKSNLKATTPRETKAEKEARFEANKALLDAILATGERDAIEWVIRNGADYISPDQMKEIRLDVVRTQDKGLIDVMLGKNAENFGAIMKDAPDLHEEVAKLYKGLVEVPVDKRTDAQKGLITLLDKAKDKKGYTVPAQKDANDNELVGERSMVFGSKGETYWVSQSNYAYDGKKLEAFGKAWNAAKKLDKPEDKNKALVKAITDSISDDRLLNKTITKNFLPEIDKVLTTVTDKNQKAALAKSIMDKYTPEVVANLDKDSYNVLNLFVRKYGTEDQKTKFLKEHPLKKDLDNRKEDNPITKSDLEEAAKQSLTKRKYVGNYPFYEYNNKEYYFGSDNNMVAKPIGYKYGLEILNQTETDSGVSEDQFDVWFGTEGNPRITKDNILAVIKGFSDNAEDKKGLIQTLDDDIKGPSKAQMDKIVNLVLGAAKAADLEQDEAYTALSNALANATAGLGGDYSSGKAKALDDAINTLIEKMDEKAEKEATAAKNKASASAKNKEATAFLETVGAYKNTKAYADLVKAIKENNDASKNTLIDDLINRLKDLAKSDKAEGMDAYKLTGEIDPKLQIVMARVNEELVLLKESTTVLTEPDAKWYIDLSDNGRVLLEIKNWEVVGISVQYDNTNEENFYMTAEELRYDSDKKDASFDGVVKNDQYNWTAWKERMEKLFGIKEAVAVQVPDGTENKDDVQAKFNEATVFLQQLEPNCAKDIEAQKHTLGGWTKTYTLSDGKSVAVWYDEQGEIKQLHINTDGEAKFKSGDGSMKDKVEVSIANDLAGVRLDSSHEDYDSRISSGFDFEQVKRVIEALFGKFEVPIAEE